MYPNPKEDDPVIDEFWLPKQMQRSLFIVKCEIPTKKFKYMNKLQQLQNNIWNHQLAKKD